MSLLLRRKRRFSRLLQPPPSEEALEGERPYFTGPLGIWPWPIVNLILALVDLTRSSVRAQTPATVRYFPKVARRRREYIRDGSGRIMEILEEVELE